MFIFFVILVVAIVVLIGITITGNVTKEDSPGQTTEEGNENCNEEEMEQEWADVNEKIKFVCQGGKVQCQFCAPPIANIIVTSSTIML